MKEADQPQPQTFARAAEFITANHAVDNWFLQIPGRGWGDPQLLRLMQENQAPPEQFERLGLSLP